MENDDINNLVNFLQNGIFPQNVLNSDVQSEAMSNYRRKASTFRVSQGSQLFKVNIFDKASEIIKLVYDYKNNYANIN